MPASQPSNKRRTRIVVVGAGFGGLAVVRALRGADVDVTLIDRTNHHLFQPLLYQVATAALSPAEIATANRVLLHRSKNVSIVMGEVTGVDLESKHVKLRATEDYPYDYLVLATGADYSYFGNEQWSQHSWVLKTLDDAAKVRDRVLGAFEWAETRADPDQVRRLLTFVVVGGGPTGVELAGNIAELARATLAQEFRRIDPRSARVLLFESGPRLLASFAEPLSAYAHKALRSLGVDLHLDTKVTDIDAQAITAGAERIETANVFWAAGTAARPAAAWLRADAAHNGAVKVSETCRVPRMHNVFAIGDVAHQLDAQGRPLPGLGAVAQQQGTYVGKLVRAEVEGKPFAEAFRYRDRGTLAVIGRYRAVAQLPRMHFTGTVAWLMWALIHLMLLMNFRSKFAVYCSWCWTWLTNNRGASLVSDLSKLNKTEAS